MKKHLPLILLVIFALAGLIDSTLIHLKEIVAKTDPNAFASCSTDGILNCASVAASKYSHLLGIPVSLIGIWFYEASLILGIVLIMGLPLKRIHYILLTLGIAGSLTFSLYLLFMSYFGVGSLCRYCLISNATTLGISITWLVYVLPILKKKES